MAESVPSFNLNSGLICVIFNPAARGEKATRLRKQLDQVRGSWALKPTTGPGAARQLATDAVHEGFDTIVAAGGDGTLNEVLNGIADVPAGLSRARLGILPLGTINVFARELKLPSDLEKACEILETGSELAIDLPCAEFTRDGKRESRCFIQLAGAGWDARSVELVNWELKKRIGPGAYVVAGLQALISPQATITISNGTQTHTGELVLIGNGKFYGGSFPIFHQSDYQDGVLDACVFEKVNWQSLPRHLWQFASGKLFKPGGTLYLQGREFHLSSPTRAALQLEGELVGELPAKISVLPEKLRVLVPKRNSSSGGG